MSTNPLLAVGFRPASRPQRPGHRGALRFAFALTLAPLSLSGQAQRLAPLADALIEAAVPAAHDQDALFAQLVEAARGLHASPASAAAMRAASRNAARLARPRDALQALEAVLAASPHGLTAQIARETRANILRSLGHEDAIEATTTAYADFASHALCVGPFGDEGDEMIGVPFDPEFEFPAPGRELRGRFGPVSSRVVRRDSDSSRLDLVRPERANETGCFYLLHQVRAANATS